MEWLFVYLLCPTEKQKSEIYDGQVSWLLEINDNSSGASTKKVVLSRLKQNTDKEVDTPKLLAILWISGSAR